MALEVIIEDAGPFKALYNLPPDIHLVCLIGGRGGRKTYETSKFIAKRVAVDRKRVVVLRDEKELIGESILNEIFNRYDSANQYGHFDGNTMKLENGLRDRKTKEMLLFTKGFRASDNQKKANLKGASNIDIAVIEEMEDIRDETKFNTFRDSIRKEGALVIMILNTPDIKHWVVQRYFDWAVAADAVDANGAPVLDYFVLTPKPIKGFFCIQTGYKDNQYLPENIIDQYEAYGNPLAATYSPFYYYTAIKGYASTGRKGQILNKVKPISLEDYLALPFKEYYGQDFGTASPAGLVGVKFDGNNCWCRQINYLPMNVLRIGRLYCQLKFDASDIIIADSADPISIGKLRNGFPENEMAVDDIEKNPGLLNGWTVYGVPKPKGCIEAGLSKMDSMELYAVRESTDLWNEIGQYIWGVDKNMQPTGEPIDDFNHLIDPWRYVIQCRGRFF